MPRRESEARARASVSCGSAKELRHALVEILARGELRDPALSGIQVTVTEVRLSPDLRNATAFVMPLGGANAAEIIAGLRRSAPFLKGRVAHAVRLRRVPNLAFALDIAFDSADRIAAILHSEAVERDLQKDDE